MKKQYFVNWESNGNATHGRLGPYTSKQGAIRDGRDVVKGNQFVGGASGGFTVEEWLPDVKTVAFSEIVTIRQNGAVIFRRNHDAEGGVIND